MSKTTKRVLIVVVIALLVFAIALFIYNKFKTEPIDANTVKGNVLSDANEGLGNLIADILNEEETNNIENTEDTENVENKVTNTQTSKPSNNQSSKEDIIDSQSTSGEKKAIELAKEEWKKKWGDLEDVSFNNVMIQGDGKYVVSVNDISTTTVIKFYVVDIVTGLVEER